MNVAKVIYRQLDTLTDGIESFLVNGQTRTWRGFLITAFRNRRIMFGIMRDEEDVYPDPGFECTVGNGLVELDPLIIYAKDGWFVGDSIRGANRCTSFLEQVLQGNPPDSAEVVSS